VERINESEAFKISVDLPSGLSSETGRGSCVDADLVVTFHRPKKGLERYNYVVADIGIPEKAESHVGPGEVAVNLGKRKHEAKKGDYGRVLILGGSLEYYGAPLLAAIAAQNSGVDLVFLAVPEVNYEVTRSYYPDFIVRKYPGTTLNSEGVALALELAEKCDSLVVGPGLGTDSETKRAVLDILKEIRIPAVVDADALKAIAGERIECNAVLTPHRAEFKLLTGEELPSELEDRANAVREWASKLGAVMLLKAPIDVIASPEGKVKYNSTGNPGMTVGGTGDVLAGLVGGFLAQGLSSFDAACCAAFVNGCAGDGLYEEKGYAFSASDLAMEIPYTIKKLIDFARS
jgi:NAD(P)H-hydrate epimerase